LDASKKEASPGAFLSWLVDQLKPAAGFQQHRVEGVKGYEIIGEWFDIGNPTDLKIAYFWYTNVVLGQLRTVEDLIVARATRRVDDKSYLVCRRVSVSPNSQAGIRTLRFFFETSDELCSLRKAGRGLKTVAEIKAGKDNALWERIESSLNSGDLPFNWVDSEAEIQAPDAHAPILLSGGVFLLDSDNAGLFKTRVLIPLLEKDIGSATDARRFTTPAGRIDDLDFRQVCSDELMEEFVFFGRESDTYKTRIYCPQLDSYSDRRADLLEHIIKNKVQIPGILQSEIGRALDGLGLEDTGIIENYSVYTVPPPAEMGSCQIEIYLGRKNPVSGSIEYRIRNTSGSTSSRYRMPRITPWNCVSSAKETSLVLRGPCRGRVIASGHAIKWGASAELSMETASAGRQL
jgi:hypothetical protein